MKRSGMQRLAALEANSTRHTSAAALRRFAADLALTYGDGQPPELLPRAAALAVAGEVYANPTPATPEPAQRRRRGP